MKILIKNKENSIEIRTPGFLILRQNIACLLSEEFGMLYKNWCVPCSTISDENGNKILKSMYDNGILTDSDDVIIEFLFAPEHEGKITPEGCKRLYELIKDYTDDIYYGWSMDTNCARFDDFKHLIKESAENNWIVKWRYY